MRHALVVLTICLAVSSAISQDYGFPFQFPKSTPMNPEFLGISKQEVAGSKGFVKVQNGHFTVGDGERLRFFGTNMQLSSFFPDSAEAITVARRLRYLGYNSVRIQYWDYPFWSDISFLSATNPTRSDELNPVQMKKFDWFAYQLKQQGIYLFIPVHSLWQPRTEDGIFNGDSVGFGARPAIFIDKSLRVKIKNTFKLFLNHTNDFTKSKYRDEPQIALLSLSDESSLSQWWVQNQLVPGATTTPYISRMLDTLYNNWLKKKYGATVNLKSAWNVNSSTSSNLLSNADFEDLFDPSWSLQVTAEVAQAVLTYSDGDKVSGAYSAKISIGKPGTSVFEILFSTYNLKVEKYRNYKLSFFAKTDAQTQKRNITPYILRNGPPYDSYGDLSVIEITKDWKEYSIPFRARVTDSVQAWLIFALGGSSGTVFLDNVRFEKLADNSLSSSEDFTNYSVARTLYADKTLSYARAADMTAFYDELQTDYYDEMQSFLKSEGVRSLVTNSAQSSSLMDVTSAEKMDFTTGYTFWDFASNSDKPDWSLSSISYLANPASNTIDQISRAKIKNKPLVMCGMYQHFPSRYRESVSAIFTYYSAYQDWDGLFLTWYASDKNRLSAPAIDSMDFTYTHANSAYNANLPVLSRIFRDGLLRPALKTLSFNYSNATRMYTPFQVSSHFTEVGENGLSALFRRIEIDSMNASKTSESIYSQVQEIADLDLAKLQTDTQELTWNSVDSVLTLHTKFVKGMIREQTLGSIVKVGAGLGSVTFEDGAIVTIVSLDRMDAVNKRYGNSLLCQTARGQNTGTKWVGTPWSNPTKFSAWGGAPFRIINDRLAFSLTSPADEIRVHPLDSLGNPLGSAIVMAKTGTNRHYYELKTSVTPTPWLRLEFVDLSSVEKVESKQRLNIFPNPSTSTTPAQVSVAHDLINSSSCVLEISTVEGKIVAQLREGFSDGDDFVFTLPSDLSSGFYTVAVRSNGSVFRSSFVQNPN